MTVQLAVEWVSRLRGIRTLRIDYSTLNYKDALAIANKRSPIVRTWPMVAGIDAAGVVTSSTHPGFAAGDAVVLNGWGLGETRWGGLAQATRAPGEWLVKLPPPLTPHAAAAIGTAGYTEAMCVQGQLWEDSPDLSCALPDLSHPRRCRRLVIYRDRLVTGTVLPLEY